MIRISKHTKAGITYGRFENGGLIPHDLRHTLNTYIEKGGGGRISNYGNDSPFKKGNV